MGRLAAANLATEVDVLVVGRDAERHVSERNPTSLGRY
jgi:hypothetical protein